MLYCGGGKYVDEMGKKQKKNHFCMSLVGQAPDYNVKRVFWIHNLVHRKIPDIENKKNENSEKNFYLSLSLSLLTATHSLLSAICYRFSIEKFHVRCSPSHNCKFHVYTVHKICETFFQCAFWNDTTVNIAQSFSIQAKTTKWKTYSHSAPPTISLVSNACTFIYAHMWECQKLLSGAWKSIALLYRVFVW
jgi:hypothetical protein